MIVRFTPAYYDGVISLISIIQNREYNVVITHEEQPELQDVLSFYGSGSSAFWVALDEESVVGSIGFLDLGAGRAALRKMYVRQDRRGPKAGYARRLLETLLDHAAQVNVNRIYLGTGSTPRIDFTLALAFSVWMPVSSPKRFQGPTQTLSSS